mmetsp:Transcript_39462/g.123076  ORF Transcript_39462/g.123076 Transcript_39462/m.123076 type:complete len:236 (-) Transcript_39462:379-1086(-)
MFRGLAVVLLALPILGYVHFWEEEYGKLVEGDLAAAVDVHALKELFDLRAGHAQLERLHQAHELRALHGTTAVLVGGLEELPQALWRDAALCEALLGLQPHEQRLAVLPHLDEGATNDRQGHRHVADAPEDEHRRRGAREVRPGRHVAVADRRDGADGKPHGVGQRPERHVVFAEVLLEPEDHAGGDDRHYHHQQRGHAERLAALDDGLHQDPPTFGVPRDLQQPQNGDEKAKQL